MLIPCPYCGSRDISEFSYGGDATIQRPHFDSVDLDEWCHYMYSRSNPLGDHEEHWQHTHGCRLWFRVKRNTLTQEIATPSLISAPDSKAIAANSK